MANTRISSADYTDMTNQVEDYSVSTAEQDSPGTEYTPDWSKWFGHYKAIPEVRAVIDRTAIWVIGKGFKADARDKQFLDRIKGNGKDTFNTIIGNQVRTAEICGDSFAEIIRNKRAELINLKPLNPSSIKILSNGKGMITGYNQITSADGKNFSSWEPNQIFHLAWNRLGDECHGRSSIEALENIILMKNESMTDMKIVFHRYVKPLIISQADTDDATEIAALKAKIDNAVKLGENMIVPKDTVEMERMSIPQYSTLDPLPWIQLLNRYFVMSAGVPEVILGIGTETTEATAKILYLAFQQNIEYKQLFLEQQIKAQLRMDVEFNFPASLEEQQQENVSKEHKGMNTGTGGIREKEKKKPEKG